MSAPTIPSINIDTPIPRTIKLREKGQPLEGLYIAHGNWHQLAYVKISERYARWSGGTGQLIGYHVTTVGLAPQTKRETEFDLRGRADMVKHVNAWIAKTVAAGLKKMAEHQAAKAELTRIGNDRIAKQIEAAGGVEARRQQIAREGYDRAARDAMQYESPEVFGAVIASLLSSTPVTLDEKVRDRILAKYEGARESESVSRYIDSEMRELDAYLAQEGAQ